MPEAALYYGLLMAKVAPERRADPVCRRNGVGDGPAQRSGDGRWWLAAGLFAGLALLSKFTVS